MERLYEQREVVKIMKEKSGKPADWGLWELTDSECTARNGTDLGLLHLYDNYKAWSFVGPQAVGAGLVPDV